MSSLATVIKDESLWPTLRAGLYGLGACSVVALAAYAGYRAAGPKQHYVLRNRHPESNDQVIAEFSFSIVSKSRFVRKS